MILKLNEIEVDCVIGERAEERMRLQTLKIDVKLEISDMAAHSDNLSDTVDYAALTERIRSALVAAKCRMIERAALVVAEVCKAECLVHSVQVAVTKSGAIPHLKSATAEIVLKKIAPSHWEVAL